MFGNSLQKGPDMKTLTSPTRKSRPSTRGVNLDLTTLTLECGPLGVNQTGLPGVLVSALSTVLVLPSGTTKDEKVDHGLRATAAIITRGALSILASILARSGRFSRHLDKFHGTFMLMKCAFFFPLNIYRTFFLAIEFYTYVARVYSTLKFEEVMIFSVLS
jgi:hypothetical protein